MKQIISIVTLMLFGLVLSARTAHADAKADAKAVMTTQLEALKKGDLAAIKAGFTKRLQDKITDDKVKKGQKEAGKFTIDDLVDSVEAKGADSLKIKMKGGRTLTTLVKVDGKWLADTIWFN